MPGKIVIHKAGIFQLFIFAALITACGNRNAALNTLTPAIPLTGVEQSLIVKSLSPDEKAIVVEKVISNGPGWLAVHTQENNQPGPVIAYIPVKDGVNEEITIPLDPNKATQEMDIILHTDAGEMGVFEFPGPDKPATVNGKTINSTFMNATHGTGNTGKSPPSEGNAEEDQNNEAGNKLVTGLLPKVQAVDQDVIDGAVIIHEVISLGPGWLVIYSQEDGQPIKLIGKTAVKNGGNKDIRVEVDSSQVTPELYALLYIDSGEIGVFEYPGSDIPALSDVGVVLDQFKSSSAETAQITPTVDANTPRVTAVDQIIRGGTIKVAEAVSQGPGWLGVHVTSANGGIGSAIGSAPLNDGVNRDLIVKINPKRATETMIVMIHTDGGRVGIWEYPGPDEPVIISNQMVMQPIQITGGLTSQEVRLQVASGEAPYLLDGQGLSLYISLADDPGLSRCYNECRSTWLPMIATGPLKAGEGVSIDKLGIIMRPDKVKQVTYNGLPLYYYAGDDRPGEKNGQGTDGLWFLSNP